MDSEVVVFLRGQITDFQRKMGQASSDIEKVGSKGGGTFQKLSTVGGAALAGLGGAAIAVGGFSLHMADQFEQANARLRNAVTNSGNRVETFQKQIDQADSRLEKFGFTSTDVQNALATLTQVTHSPAKALQDIGLAADIARARNIDLSTATSILAKVETGHVALLGRLGINTKDATGHTISQTEAVRRLAAMYGGAAAASADTFSGKVRALKTEATDLAIKLGVALIPIIEKVVSAIVVAAQWFERHRTVALALAAVVGGVLLVAIGAYIAGMVSAAAATIAATWPILAVIVGVAALAAGIIYLWTHWNQVWTWIQNHKAYAAVIALMFPIVGQIVLIVGVLHFFYENWNTIWNAATGIVRVAWGIIGPTVLAIVGVIRAAVAFVSAILHGDWSAAWQAALAIITNAWRAIASAVSAWIGVLGSLIGGLAGRIAGWIGDLGGALYGKGVQLIQGLINGIRSQAGSVAGAILNAIPGGGILGGIAHNILGLASGGIVNHPTLAVVGEAGPEAVIPLRGLHTGGVQPLTGALVTAGTTAAGGTAQVMNVTVNGFVGSEANLVDLLQRYLRRGGRIAGLN